MSNEGRGGGVGWGGGGGGGETLPLTLERDTVCAFCTDLST